MKTFSFISNKKYTLDTCLGSRDAVISCLAPCTTAILFTTCWKLHLQNIRNLSHTEKHDDQTAFNWNVLRHRILGVSNRGRDAKRMSPLPSSIEETMQFNYKGLFSRTVCVWVLPPTLSRLTVHTISERFVWPSSMWRGLHRRPEEQYIDLINRKVQEPAPGVRDVGTEARPHDAVPSRPVSGVELLSAKDNKLHHVCTSAHVSRNAKFENVRTNNVIVWLNCEWH